MAVHPEAYLHPQALVDEGAQVGARTRVWAYAHVLGGARIGEDCNICDHTFVEGKVRLGDRVTVKCGVYLWDGIVAEDDVFFGPAAVVTNDKHPRSKQRVSEYPVTRFRRGASVGAGAVILPGLTIGEWCTVGAGAVVTRDVSAYSIVVGNPARVVGSVCRCGERLAERDGEMEACLACGLRYLRDETGLKEIQEEERHGAR